MCSQSADSRPEKNSRSRPGPATASSGRPPATPAIDAALVRSMASRRTAGSGLVKAPSLKRVVVVVAHGEAIEGNAQTPHAINQIALVVCRQMVGIIEIYAVQAHDPRRPLNDIQGGGVPVPTRPVAALIDAKGIEARREFCRRLGIVETWAIPPRSGKLYKNVGPCKFLKQKTIHMLSPVWRAFRRRRANSASRPQRWVKVRGRLETGLGTTLLVKAGRQIKLTEAG